MSHRTGALAALVLVASVVLAGCATRGEGEETVTLTNAAGEPLRVVLVLTQEEGGIRVFSQDVLLDVGQTQTYELAMKPGPHTAQITTSTSIAETLDLDLPKTGDTEIRVVIQRGKASVSLIGS